MGVYLPPANVSHMLQSNTGAGPKFWALDCISVKWTSSPSQASELHGQAQCEALREACALGSALGSDDEARQQQREVVLAAQAGSARPGPHCRCAAERDAQD